MARITVRKADARGQTRLDWLDSRHSFSFGGYHDPAHMGFGSLRVINDDRVRPGAGFGTHAHRDMEILTWVLEGALQHRDSLGNGSVIRPGDLQRLSAGTGITHSEFNPSEEEPVHFLQIWILPRATGLAPGYDQRHFGRGQLQGRLHLVASPDGREGSVSLNQDAGLRVGRFGPGEGARCPVPRGRSAWLQVARGALSVNGEPLAAGDAAAVTEPCELSLEAVADTEVLLFELARARNGGISP